MAASELSFSLQNNTNGRKVNEVTGTLMQHFPNTFNVSGN
jgi:hypothetical protein